MNKLCYSKRHFKIKSRYVEGRGRGFSPALGSQEMIPERGEGSPLSHKIQARFSLRL